MSKLMSVLGIVLLAIGVALALVGLVNPAQMQINGVSMDSAATLVVGGILSIGLGGVIAALDRRGIAAIVADEETETVSASSDVEIEQTVAPSPVEASETEAPAPARIRFTGFGRKPAEAAAAATAAVVESTVTNPAAKSSVQDTLEALEKAKKDIANAMGGVESMASAASDDDQSADDTSDDTTLAEGELYVIEEKIIRGRPARVLSDDTVEAETDEGWMRFENLQHLNEYLDAAEQA